MAQVVIPDASSNQNPVIDKILVEYWKTAFPFKNNDINESLIKLKMGIKRKNVNKINYFFEHVFLLMVLLYLVWRTLYLK